MSVVKAVLLDLTDEQIKQLRPLFDFAEQEFNHGRPGAVLAQPFDGGDLTAPAQMRVGFVEHERAKAVQEILECKVHKPRRAS